MPKRNAVYHTPQRHHQRMPPMPPVSVGTSLVYSLVYNPWSAPYRCFPSLPRQTGRRWYENGEPILLGRPWPSAAGYGDMVSVSKESHAKTREDSRGGSGLRTAACLGEM